MVPVALRVCQSELIKSRFVRIFHGSSVRRYVRAMKNHASDRKTLKLMSVVEEVTLVSVVALD